MAGCYWVYIVASESGTLYTGVTNNLERRMWEHKEGLVEGFTKKYGCYKLLYAEEFQDVKEAITREKQIKNWRREKKENIIRMNNPGWRDISLDWA